MRRLYAQGFKVYKEGNEEAVGLAFRPTARPGRPSLHRQRKGQCLSGFR